MIPTPSIVAVDDNQQHLDMICLCLKRMGHSCFPVIYRNGKARISRPLQSVQFLFFDIEYVPGAADADKLEIATGVLEKIISPRNGPYVLITWSTHRNLYDDFITHLTANLKHDIPPPAASALLDKNQFLAAGKLGQPSYSILRQKITGIVKAQKELNVLLTWSNAAKVAAGQTVEALLRLLPREERFSGVASHELGRLMRKIAEEGGGKDADRDLTFAMNEGLAPILLDRLLHATAADKKILEKAWRDAVPPGSASVSLKPDERASLNAMVYASQHDLENSAPGTRGAVSTLPLSMKSDAGFKRHFGDKKENIIKEYVELKGPNKTDPVVWDRVMKSIAWRLVGYSAACDQAQKKVPKNLQKAFLAVEISSILETDCRLLKGLQIEATMPFKMSNKEQKLVFNWHRTISATGEMKGAKVCYRLREPFITALISRFHSHGTRLGNIEFK